MINSRHHTAFGIQINLQLGAPGYGHLELREWMGIPILGIAVSVGYGVIRVAANANPAATFYKRTAY